MERKVQSIVAAATFVAFRPFDIEAFWPGAVVLAGLVATWPAVGVLLARFQNWYKWRITDTNDFLKDAIMADAYDSAGVDPSDHDELSGLETLQSQQQVVLAVSLAAWMGYVVFFAVVYGIVWPGRWDTLTIVGGVFAVSFLLTVVLGALKRALFDD